MEHIVLDTNVFFNMEAGISMGKNTEEVMKTFIQVARREKDKVTFYMPPRVVEEVESFFESPQNETLKELLAEITVKSPDISELNFPAAVFYRLIEDVRGRSYRGLQIAEEEVEKTATQMMGKEQLPKVAFQKSMGPIVKNLRNRYRNATRNGFLDSLTDLDIIVLAKELEGSVVTTDEGVLVWARHFGVRELPAHVFGKRFAL